MSVYFNAIIFLLPIQRSVGITAIELADGDPPLSELHPMRALFQVTYCVERYIVTSIRLIKHSTVCWLLFRFLETLRRPWINREIGALLSTTLSPFVWWKILNSGHSPALCSIIRSFNKCHQTPIRYDSTITWNIIESKFNPFKNVIDSIPVNERSQSTNCGQK